MLDLMQKATQLEVRIVLIGGKNSLNWGKNSLNWG